MENKMKEYGSIALVVIVSVSAFYVGKYAVQSAINYYSYRNQSASSLPNTTVTNGDMEDARKYLQSNPNDREVMAKICVESFKKEAVKQNIVGVFSDASVKSYCECALDEIKNGATFDVSVTKCAQQKLVR
jgi:hypothetical protein